MLDALHVIADIRIKEAGLDLHVLAVFLRGEQGVSLNERCAVLMHSAPYARHPCWMLDAEVAAERAEVGSEY